MVHAARRARMARMSQLLGSPHRLIGVSRRHPSVRESWTVATKPLQPGASPFLSLVAPHLPPALEQINVPACVIDSGGRIRWLNEAAIRIVGDAVGKLLHIRHRPGGHAAGAGALRAEPPR